LSASTDRFTKEDTYSFPICRISRILTLKWMNSMPDTSLCCGTVKDGLAALTLGLVEPSRPAYLDLQISSWMSQKVSAARGHTAPSVDNLFSACELVSKAHLILHRSPAGRAKSHGPVHSAINARRRLGNVNEEFVKLFNQMSNARSSARYDVGGQVEAPSQSDFQIVEREITDLTKHVAPRVSTHDHKS